MNNIIKLYKYLPNDSIDWELINTELLYPYYQEMKNTFQEPKWHAEGDVYTHTKMVCEKLISFSEYKELSDIEKLVVFLGALFHDIGKTVCTKVINNEITSPHHGPTGAMMLREYFWKELGISGTKEYQSFRESICFLLKYHSNPIHDYEDKLEKRIIKLASNQALAEYFSIKLLALLSKADALGRIGPDDDYHLLNISKFINKAKELDCFDKPFIFTDSYTKYQYLNKPNIWPYQTLYNNTWGEVILICGLPGTGKDTYIKEYFKGYEIISLDDIRKEFNISPTENQGKTYNIAKERAKELLRNKIPFIWNATNLTDMIRNKQINLFHDYNASVKTIFLETSYKENLIRNKSRKKIVDEAIINKLLSNINMPEADISEDVIWICI